VVHRRLEGGLVHPRLAVLEDVFEVLAQQAPAEEVIFLAIGTGDDHAEEAALLQGGTELGQVGQVIEQRSALLIVDGLRLGVVLGLERVEGVGHRHLYGLNGTVFTVVHGSAVAHGAVLDLHRSPLLASRMVLPRTHRGHAVGSVSIWHTSRRMPRG
jgi:hypothetical protein